MEMRIFAPTALRVKLNTSSKINQKIDDKIETTIQNYANSSSEDITSRIKKLEAEWDTERILEANATIIILVSLALGLLFNNWWFLLTGLVAFYLLQHAIQGWCPPLPILRKLGVRTMTEINTEITALKILRKDFENIKPYPLEVLKAAKH